MLRNILFAEDDEDDRMFIAEALKDQKNLHIIFASDGEKASILLHQGLIIPHIIFLDLNMPFKDGKECLKEIRNNKEFDDSLVIILSTSRNPEDVYLTYNLGANLFVIKPSDFQSLKSMLLKLINDIEMIPQKKLSEHEFLYQF